MGRGEYFANLDMFTVTVDFEILGRVGISDIYWCGETTLTVNDGTIISGTNSAKACAVNHFE